MYGTILIHELLNSLQAFCGKDILIKLDMIKAFNKVNLSFVICIRSKFGFDDG